MAAWLGYQDWGDFMVEAQVQVSSRSSSPIADASAGLLVRAQGVSSQGPLFGGSYYVGIYPGRDKAPPRLPRHNPSPPPRRRCVFRTTL